MKHIQQRPFRLADDAADLGAELKRDNQNADDDKRHPVRIMRGRHGLNNGQYAEEGGNRIDDEHRLAMTEAQLAQAMVQMPLVWRKNRLLLHRSAHNREERIRQRNADNQERRNERDDGNLLKAQQGQYRQAEPKEQRSGIPHKDFGRVKVKKQKPDNAAKQHGAQQNHHWIAHKDRHGENGGNGNSGYASRQSVQPVNQVNGIRHAHNPEDRERNRNPGFDIQILIAERHINEIDCQIKAEHDDAGRDNLADQLHLGRQFKPVIQRPRQHDNGPSGEQCPYQAGITATEQYIRNK